MLDVDLRGEMAFPVADALAVRHIPFLFASGYDHRMIGDRYPGIDLCHKPFSKRVLLDLLTHRVPAGVDDAAKVKASYLAAIAFGTQPAFDDVAIGGVRHVLAADIAQAASLGYRVRLVGVAEAGEHGLFQRVHAHLVPADHPLAHVTGATNAVVAEGNYVGRLLFQGAGAGEGPTASAVVADLIDIARGEFGPAFAMPVEALVAAEAADSGERRGRAYLRFTVADRVGVLAEIAAAMRDAGVSIESLIQRGANPGGAVLVAIVTHEGPERCVAAALERLRGSQSLVGEPLWMHILG